MFTPTPSHMSAKEVLDEILDRGVPKAYAIEVVIADQKMSKKYGLDFWFMATGGMMYIHENDAMILIDNAANAAERVL